MQLGAYLAPLDARAVLFHGLGVLRVLSLVLLPPAAVALVAGELPLGLTFLALAAAAAALSLGRQLLGPRDLETREAVVVTALAYALFAAVGAVPFLEVTRPLDAFFEAMSGFTTTGLTLLDPETLSPGLVFFRAYAQWVGGAGIIILSLAVLTTTGKAALRLYGSEYRGEDILGSVRASAALVTRTYLVLTACGLVAFLGAGLGPFDALTHVLATLSTGGFGAYENSIGAFASPWVTGVVLLFMGVGATPFPLYHRLLRRGPSTLLRNLEVRSLGAAFLAGALAIYLARLAAGAAGGGGGALGALFDAGTALTTTGFTLTDPASWSPGVRLLAVLLMIVGGCGRSTAGGLKVWRVVLLAKSLRLYLVRALLPQEARLSLRYQGQAIPAGEQVLVLSFVTLYLTHLALSTLLLALAGFGTGDALFESASSLGTVGLSAGVTSPGLAAWAKLLLIFNMWAGRLELLPVLLLFHPGTWKMRESSR